METILNCCRNVYSALPASELPFVPALILGTFCSIVFLVLLYKKHHRKTFWDALICMLKDIFISAPKSEHSEFMKCDIDTCIKCKKAESLKTEILKEWKKSGFKENVHPRITEAMKRLSKKLNNIKDHSDTKLSKNQKPTIFEMELPSNPIWTDLDCYNTERNLMKSNFKVVKEEFTKIFDVFQTGNTWGWKLNHIPEGHWCIFPLIDQGKINEENCTKCPNTSTLLSSFPSMMKNCVFGNVFFSLLYPDSHIEPHFGPTNLRLRCHFNFQIPEGCWLEVNGTQLKWEEGECIVFDDSFEHSAYYAPRPYHDLPRVVLIVDFWHPSITKEEQLVLQKLFHAED